MNPSITTKFNLSHEEYQGHLSIVNQVAPQLAKQGLAESQENGSLEKFLNSLERLRIKDSREALRVVLQQAEPKLVDLVVPVAQSSSEIVDGTNQIGERIADVLEFAQVLREVPESLFRIDGQEISAPDMARSIESSAMAALEFLTPAYFADAMQPLKKVVPHPNSDEFRHDLHTEQFAAISKLLGSHVNHFVKVFEERRFFSYMADDVHDLVRHFSNEAVEDQYLPRTSQLFDVLSYERQREVLIEEAQFRGSIVDHPILSRYAESDEALDSLVKEARELTAGANRLPPQIRVLDV